MGSSLNPTNHPRAQSTDISHNAIVAKLTTWRTSHGEFKDVLYLGFLRTITF